MMLLKQKNRQMQSFLRKYNSKGNFHDICCKNQQSDFDFQELSTKIKQPTSKITLKKQQKSSFIRSNHHHISEDLRPTKQHAFPHFFQSIHPSKQKQNPELMVHPKRSTINKISFNYPLMRVKSNQILPTSESLPMIKSQHISVRLQYSQISNHSLQNKIKPQEGHKIPVSEAKSTSKVDYTISMQNQSQQQMSHRFSRPISPSVDLQLYDNAFGDSRNQSKWIGDGKSEQSAFKMEPIQYQTTYDDKTRQLAYVKQVKVSDYGHSEQNKYKKAGAHNPAYVQESQQHQNCSNQSQNGSQRYSYLRPQ